MEAPVLDLHAALVGIPSISHEEEPIADFVEHYLRRAEAPVEVGRLENNIWASLGDGDDLLLLASHLDVVPPSTDHPYPPFEPRRVSGRVYGRGAVDAKASGAAMLRALIDLAAEGFRPPGRVVVALTACEEAGRYNGLEHLRLDVFGTRLPPVTSAVVGEPTELRPCLAQKGLLILTATARGQAAHAARAHLGTNALTVAARDLLVLDGFAFEKFDSLLGAPTVAGTLIEGGTAKNIVPDRCTFTLDVRSTPAYTHAELTELFRGALQSQVEVYSDRLVPCRTAPDARVARAAHAALTHLDFDAEPFGSPTTSDWIFLHDVPTVKLGPGRSELSHTAEEHVEVDELTRAVEVYRQTILHYFDR